MYTKMLQYSKNLKGTKYEAKMKDPKGIEFYCWMEKILEEFYRDNGWDF